MGFTVPTYMMGGEVQAREFAPTSDVKENGLVDNYRVPERSQPVPESESALEANQPAESNGSVQNVVNASQENSPTSVDESVGEPQKHTYASIVRAASSNFSPFRHRYTPDNFVIKSNGNFSCLFA